MRGRFAGNGLIIQMVASRLDMDRDLVKKVVHEYIDALTSVIEEQIPVVIRGFGTFRPKTFDPMGGYLPAGFGKKERSGSDIDRTKTVRFLPSKLLKKRLTENQKTPEPDAFEKLKRGIFI